MRPGASPPPSARVVRFRTMIGRSSTRHGERPHRARCDSVGMGDSESADQLSETSGWNPRAVEVAALLRGVGGPSNRVPSCSSRTPNILMETDRHAHTGPASTRGLQSVRTGSRARLWTRSRLSLRACVLAGVCVGLCLRAGACVRSWLRACVRALRCCIAPQVASGHCHPDQAPLLSRHPRHKLGCPGSAALGDPGEPKTVGVHVFTRGRALQVHLVKGMMGGLSSETVGGMREEGAGWCGLGAHVMILRDRNTTS